ncbi:Tripartite tricarboxylate transporter family receptor [Pigmentiphaga humi]|uniref:Tripartite tricarboxylate transporter family receptor n=1 Tax=Pigmentiphaga humi TaxID=2478468 RepID=A0A3P4B683_9BURK|nr:tripartite tricarboxylate transporter substrate-binding protein [Pigmentiphaga humi]VCU71797.1 Tripartite tricarboxylate transporter family receptor [Pigmentiphaga humi]
MVVPQAAGTEVDWLAREYATHMSAAWRVPVVVENRTGAGGDIGVGQAARAAADGYTLLFTGGSIVLNAVIGKTSYDPVRSFTPVFFGGPSYFTVAVSDKLGVRTVQDLVKLAKDKPGSLNYGSPGNGSVQNLAMELFKREAGIDIVHVPYKTAAAAVADLAGGTIDAIIVSGAQVLSLEEQGRIKVLMTISPERDPRLPDVPTAAESDFRNLKVVGWSGVLAPAGTSPEVVKKINAAFNAAREKPSMREAVMKRFGSLDKVEVQGTTKELGDLIASDLKMWGALFPASHAKDRVSNQE